MGGVARHDSCVPVTRERRRRAPLGVAAAVAATTLIVGVGLGLAAAATADTGCSQYSALAAGDGLRTLVSAGGFSPTDVDGQGPAAQAQVDSLQGSMGFAGAPFSNAAAGNAGAANVDATQVPVFAISSYPSRPDSTSSNPVLTLDSRSEQLSSAAKALLGGPSAGEQSIGQLRATAAASCASSGTIKAVAESATQLINVGGVLRIASVRSNASVTVNAKGVRKLDASMVVDGVTVLGQSVGIGDKGLIVGGSPAAPPAPDDALVTALSNAGIGVRLVAASKDQKDGDAIAPSLEVTVTRVVSGLSPTPFTTTYTFGRAYARAAGTASDTAVNVALGGDALTSPGTVASPAGSSPTATGAAASTPSGSPPSSGGPAAAVGNSATSARTGGATGRGADATAPAQRISNASAQSLYPALVIGAVVFAAAWLAFRTVGVRLRWN